MLSSHTILFAWARGPRGPEPTLFREQAREWRPLVAGATRDRSAKLGRAKPRTMKVAAPGAKKVTWTPWLWSR